MEACHFLSSAKEMKLSLKKVQNWDTLSEDQQKDLKLKLLDKIFLRQLSKMVGRGILTVGTKDTFSTEILVNPPINTTGFFPSIKARMQVEIKDDIQKELLQWP